MFLKYGSEGSISNVDFGQFQPNNQLMFSSGHFGSAKSLE